MTRVRARVLKTQMINKLLKLKLADLNKVVTLIAKRFGITPKYSKFNYKKDIKEFIDDAANDASVSSLLPEILHQITNGPTSFSSTQAWLNCRLFNVNKLLFDKLVDILNQQTIFVRCSGKLNDRPVVLRKTGTRSYCYRDTIKDFKSQEIVQMSYASLFDDLDNYIFTNSGNGYSLGSYSQIKPLSLKFEGNITFEADLIDIPIRILTSNRRVLETEFKQHVSKLFKIKCLLYLGAVYNELDKYTQIPMDLFDILTMYVPEIKSRQLDVKDYILFYHDELDKELNTPK